MPIWNEADDAPTGTVTDAGTVMLVELDVSVTVMPEVGAIPDCAGERSGYGCGKC